MKKFVKKFGFLFVVIVANLITLIFSTQTGINALTFTGKNFLNFLFMLTPIFIIIGLVDVWIDRETMIKLMGEKSGVKGALIALSLGVITAVPLYALLPVASILLKKGSRIFCVMVFLCASASIRIPLLLFEISSLGWQFTLMRFVLNLIVVFIMAFIIEKTLSEADKKAIYEKTDKESGSNS